MTGLAVMEQALKLLNAASRRAWKPEVAISRGAC